MPVLILVFAALMIATSIGYTMRGDIDSKVVISGEIAARSKSMLVYRGFVSAFLDGHPGFIGVVANNGMSLPSWYIPPAEIGNYVAGGVIYVYHTQPPPGLVGELAKVVESITVGTNVGGVLYSPGGGNTGVLLPPQVPLNATVIIQ